MPSTIWRSDTWRYIVRPVRPPVRSSARQSIAPNDASIVYPIPEQWGTLSSTHARSNLQGALAIFAVNVAGNEPVTVTFDTSRYNGVTSGSTPIMEAYEDGALLSIAAQLTNSANSQTVTIKASPTNGRHVYRLVTRSFHQQSGVVLGPWGTGGAIPPVTVDITSFGIGPTSTMDTVTPDVDYYTDTLLIYSHSRGTGVLANQATEDTNTVETAVANNVLKSWPKLVGDALRCEVGWIGQGGLLYGEQLGTYQSGSTINPGQYGDGAGAGERFFDSHWNGNARTYATVPKFALVMHGIVAGSETPDATMISGFLGALRSTFGASTMICQMQDPTRNNAAAMAAGVAAASHVRTRWIDSGVAIIDGSTPNAYTPDGSHMNELGQQAYADLVLPLLQGVIGRPPLNVMGGPRLFAPMLVR